MAIEHIYLHQNFAKVKFQSAGHAGSLPSFITGGKNRYGEKYDMSKLSNPRIFLTQIVHFAKETSVKDNRK